MGSYKNWYIYIYTYIWLPWCCDDQRTRTLSSVSAAPSREYPDNTWLEPKRGSYQNETSPGTLKDHTRISSLSCNTHVSRDRSELCSWQQVLHRTSGHSSVPPPHLRRTSRHRDHRSRTAELWTLVKMPKIWTISLWWHYWTYQLRSTASTTTFCLADSTSHGIGNMVTPGCHRTCQAGANLFESTAHHLMQRQCNMECLNGPFCALLFLWYTADLDAIVTNNGLMLYFYADNSQLYLYCHPDQIQQLRIIAIECIMDIDSWMKSNRLRLNPVKTEFLWLATPRQLYYFNDSPFILDYTIVKPTAIARNLGVMMNQDFSMRSTSINWFSLVFIRCDRFDRFGDHSFSIPPGC